MEPTQSSAPKEAQDCSVATPNICATPLSATLLTKPTNPNVSQNLLNVSLSPATEETASLRAYQSGENSKDPKTEHVAFPLRMGFAALFALGSTNFLAGLGLIAHGASIGTLPPKTMGLSFFLLVVGAYSLSDYCRTIRPAVEFLRNGDYFRTFTVGDDEGNITMPRIATYAIRVSFLCAAAMSANMVATELAKIVAGGFGSTEYCNAIVASIGVGIGAFLSTSKSVGNFIAGFFGYKQSNTLAIKPESGAKNGADSGIAIGPIEAEKMARELFNKGCALYVKDQSKAIEAIEKLTTAQELLVQAGEPVYQGLLINLERMRRGQQIP